MGAEYHSLWQVLNRLSVMLNDRRNTPMSINIKIKIKIIKIAQRYSNGLESWHETGTWNLQQSQTSFVGSKSSPHFLVFFLPKNLNYWHLFADHCDDIISIMTFDGYFPSRHKGGPSWESIIEPKLLCFYFFSLDPDCLGVMVSVPALSLESLRFNPQLGQTTDISWSTIFQSTEEVHNKSNHSTFPAKK